MRLRVRRVGGKGISTGTSGKREKRKGGFLDKGKRACVTRKGLLYAEGKKRGKGLFPEGCKTKRSNRPRHLSCERGGKGTPFSPTPLKEKGGWKGKGF